MRLYLRGQQVRGCVEPTELAFWSTTCELHRARLGMLVVRDPSQMGTRAAHARAFLECSKTHADNFTYDFRVACAAFAR